MAGVPISTDPHARALGNEVAELHGVRLEDAPQDMFDRWKRDEFDHVDIVTMRGLLADAMQLLAAFGVVDPN